MQLYVKMRQEKVVEYKKMPGSGYLFRPSGGETNFRACLFGCLVLTSAFFLTTIAFGCAVYFSPGGIIRKHINNK